MPVAIEEIREPGTFPSPNRSTRISRPITAIVLHTTEADGVRSTLDWFSRPVSGVSAHMVVDVDGALYRVVEDKDVAWHAGVSSLHGNDHGNDNVNEFSLGVELVGHASQRSFPQPQLAATAAWCALACLKYEIPLNRIVSHAAVALPVGRKVDPGAWFPWIEFLRVVARAMDAAMGTEVNGGQQ